MTDEQRSITLAKISEGLKAVYQVTAFIYSILLWESSIISPLPIPQYNHFENLYKRWIPSENMSEFYNFWDEHKRKLDDWNNDLWYDL